MSDAAGQRQLGLTAPARAQPFVKWAGGKGRLLGQLAPLLPPRFARYVEAFAGGGALFFHLHNLERLHRGALLNDLNPELMNCYRVIQDQASLPHLITRLRDHAAHVAEADYYYRVRALDRAPDYRDRHGPVERAARTLFLNHTCYNGLYRLNRRGQFNVPYGKWSRPPRIFREASLWACHGALQGVELCQEGFAPLLDRARPGDFVYLDPPYHPLSPTSSFTTYNGVAFGEAAQRRLAAAFEALDARGCLVLLSNSATPLIRGLYHRHRGETLLAPRAINSKPTGRGKIEEVAVRNY